MVTEQTYTRKSCSGRETARCRCKIRYASKFSAASRGFPCDSAASCFYTCRSDVSALQGHPRSLILVPIESEYATSYWSCTVSEVLRVFELMTPPLFHHNFGGVPVGPPTRSRCWGQFEQVPQAIFGHEITLEVFQRV